MGGVASAAAAHLVAAKPRVNPREA